MPIPKTKNVGTIIKFLKKEKPTMSKKQKLAIALDNARKTRIGIIERIKNRRNK